MRHQHRLHKWWECIIKINAAFSPCAVALNGEYGLSDVCRRRSGKSGKNGIEEIFEIALTPEKQAALNASADDVKSNIAKLATMEY